MSESKKLNFEEEVIRAAQISIAQVIQANMTGYNSPLNKLAESVIAAHVGDIRDLLESSFKGALMSDNFKAAIRSAFDHKLARALVDKLEGAIDKRVNELRSDPAFKARMLLAIEALLKPEETKR